MIIEKKKCEMTDVEFYIANVNIDKARIVVVTHFSKTVGCSCSQVTSLLSSVNNVTIKLFDFEQVTSGLPNFNNPFS